MLMFSATQAAEFTDHRASASDVAETTASATTNGPEPSLLELMNPRR
jgi:hypothetical protein